MCGIIGVFGKKDSKNLVEKGIKVISYRGKDNVGLYSKDDFCVAHCLHSIVNHVKQPLVGKGAFLGNHEIYNWKELAKEFNIKAKNDSELLFKLFENHITPTNYQNILDKLDGVYAFAYIVQDKLYLVRDKIGVKPIWYSHQNGFGFASERKALEEIGFLDVQELNPRKILFYDLKNNKIEFFDRVFFKITPEVKKDIEKIKKEVQNLLIKSIKKRVPDKQFGLLFSGGLDSTVIALIFKKLGYDFTCYTTILDDDNFKEPADLRFAIEIAKKYNLKHKIIKIKLNEIEKTLTKIIPLIEDHNVVKVGVGLTFFKACQQAKKDGCKVLFSGLGSEEIFAGYHRHKQSNNINKECISGLLKLYERDLYRDDVISMYNELELRLPFLDLDLVKYALRINEKYKIKEGVEKLILRKVALDIGLEEIYAMRPKKAAQYGSNMHKAISKLTKKNGFKYMADYTKKFYKKHNIKLGALVSSGKDSIYAMYIMMQQGYPVECMITIKSENPDSFMFHTPTINLVKLQSESIGIPLIEQETQGEKEKELDDLKKGLEKAKTKYKIQGIITGALYSNYQRQRIEKIADELGLKVFSPLWHIDQETEMREILSLGFKFIVTSVAADGLNQNWLGKEITNEDINKLVKLHKKNKINIAFEGGEAETLMLDGPLFTKRIKVIKSKKVIENEYTGKLKIIKAVLN